MPGYALVLGRTLADSTTNIWSILSTAAVGFLFGFRLPGTWQDGLAAQGMSLIASVFAFLSSAYVPATSMPGWLQPFSKYQPITPMVDAVRSVLTGSSSDAGLALAWCALLVVVFTPVAVIRYRRA